MRDMRRTGRLGELSEEAQETLLQGTLYRYGDQATEDADDGVGEAFGSAGAQALLDQSIRSAWSVRSPGDGDDPDGESQLLDALLEVSHAGSLGRWGDQSVRSFSSLNASLFNASMRDGLRSGAGTGPAGGGGLRFSAASPEGTFIRPHTADDESSSSAPAAEPRGASGEGSGEDGEGEGGGEDQMIFGTSTTSMWNSRNGGFLGASARTVAEDDADDGDGLGDLLERMALESGPLDDDLTRAVLRVLQLGSVLAGERLTEEDIEALPKVRFNSMEEQNCSICLEPYNRGELLTSLRCSHFFHVACLADWLKRSNQCPLCRAQAD